MDRLTVKGHRDPYGTIEMLPYLDDGMITFVKIH